MKFLFNIFIFLFLVCSQINAETTQKVKNGFDEVYNIEVGKIDIGTLYFKFFISDERYEVSISVEDKGLFSGIYRFKGKYDAFGQIKNGIFIPEKYNQSWKTKKKNSEINIFFENGIINSFKMLPVESEQPRIDFMRLEDYNDPITSFVSILTGNTKTQTIDGRRVYSMNLSDSRAVEKGVYKKIIINNYKNIWADHKRKNLKYIEVVQGSDLLSANPPLLIKIKLSAFSVTLTRH